MARKDETTAREDFRYGGLQVFTSAFLIGLMALMMLMFVWLAAEITVGGDLVFGLSLFGACLLFVALSRIMVRDFIFRSRWRIQLGPEEAWFSLPVWRLLSGPEPSLVGPLAYSSIAAIEWREEAMRSLGLTALNRVYAIRLKSGGVIALGEDRPVADTGQYTALAGDAARALANRARVQLVERPMAEGKTGFLTLWGNERAPWPEDDTPGALSEEDERGIRRGLALTQFVPIAAFAIIILVRIFG
ncbi:hypothetical protein [Hyphomonas sp.]|uniref:hypothetical protein n=1 Tax=Hyphomonas sp. TaxID=87 RepID=UPI00391A3B4F